jgi:hypothetical protein
VSLPEVKELPRLPSNLISGGNKVEPELAVDEVIEDSMVFEHANVASAPEPSGTPVEEIPSTPRRSPRPAQSQARETPTPKSDGEVFMDAPTSPLPPTPKQAERAAKATEQSEPQQMPVNTSATTSFGLSDLDERSLLRLVVELDSGKADRLEYHQSSVSPDGKGQKSPISQDCIVVGDSPEMVADYAPTRLTRASSTASAVSLAELDNIPSSQPTPRGSRPKRKRASSKATETGGLKRQRQDSMDETGEVPDSQTALVPGTDGEADAPGHVSAVPQENVKEEIDEERIPSSSAELSGSDSPSESNWQDSALPKFGSAMEVEGEDDEVQSQIALESFCHSQRQEMGDDEAVTPEPTPNDEPMLVDMHQPITNGKKEEEEEEEEEEKATDEMGGPFRDSNGAMENSVTPEPNQLQKILGLFRGGLDELRSAQLSRQEVYQIEDMFMDLRRELYEAERRGRA